MPEFVSLGLLAIKALVKYAPGMVESIREVISKKDPTEEDWNALFAKADKTYDQYIEGKGQ